MQFRVPREPSRPLFVQVDFGLVRDPSGKLQPKLVELQGFPSLYAYQPMLSQSYGEIFGLDPNLRYLLGGLDWEGYKKLLRRAIVADHDPSHVILMEIDPLHQKTLPDFLLTEKLLGIKTVAITDVRKVGKFLFYENAGKRTPIMRIYNRAIVDEMVRKDLKLSFQLTDDVEVEWAGHPNWFFRMSKFSLPVPEPRVRAPDLVPRSRGTDTEGPRQLRGQTVVLLRRPGRNHQSQTRRPRRHSPGTAIPVHTARADEFRAGSGNALRREQGGSTDHVHLAGRTAAGDDHHPHGPRTNDGSRPQSQYGMGGFVCRVSTLKYSRGCPVQLRLGGDFF